MFDPSTLVLLSLTKQLGVAIKTVFIRNFLRSLVSVFNMTFCSTKTYLFWGLNLAFW